jgi:inosine/guanosine/xanthosine phosphorylase family protein
VRETARGVVERLGAPDLGVVLGSGFDVLGAALADGPTIETAAIPGYPRGRVPGHRGRIRSGGRPHGTVWVFQGRVHLYEGFSGDEVAFPIALLAAAGARAVLLTCAAGGLREGMRAGELLLIGDHLNLTGVDPARGLAHAGDGPRFVDLQGAYDPEFREIWRTEAARRGVELPEEVLAAVGGPCYETPAEVRMLRTLGAGLASMSTVPETIAARWHGLRVAALACVANPGAGLGGGRPIDHADVLDSVERSVAAAVGLLVGGADGMLRSVARSVPSSLG